MHISGSGALAREPNCWSRSARPICCCKPGSSTPGRRRGAL